VTTNGCIEPVTSSESVAVKVDLKDVLSICTC
jgi:hypothetical protein